MNDGRPIAAIWRIKEVLLIMWIQASPLVRRRLVLSLVLVVVAGTLNSIGPLALKMEVDRLTHEGAAHDLLVPSAALLGVYVASQFLSRAITEMRGLIYARAERRMFRTLSERVFSHMMHLPLRYHLQRETGAAGQILENGLQGYQMILHHLVFTFLPVLAELGTTIAVLTRLGHAEFLWLFCGALACYAVAFTNAARRTSGPAKRASAARIRASATMTDAILNCELLKSMAAEASAVTKVTKVLIDSEHAGVGFSKTYTQNGLVAAFIYLAVLWVTVSRGAILVASGQMTVGEFVLVNTYIVQLLRPLEMIGYAVQAFSQGIGMLDKMLEVLREPIESQSSDIRMSHKGPAGVSFQHVAFSFAPGRPVLEDVTFEIAPGMIFGIVGTSGAGKTTIVRLLGRHYDPQCGQICIDGFPLSTISLRSLRRSVVVVSQDIQLLNDSIRNNICFGRPDATQADIDAAAQLARLHDTIRRLPQGYDTCVGERGYRLSGGERQRVSIARAALMQPRICVFDEGTSQLDSVTERDIQAGLLQITRGCTTLIVAHRLSTLIRADRIAVLDDGRIVEAGTHDDLVKRGGAYAALWNAQSQNVVAA